MTIYMISTAVCLLCFLFYGILLDIKYWCKIPHNYKYKTRIRSFLPWSGIKLYIKYLEEINK